MRSLSLLLVASAALVTSMLTAALPARADVAADQHQLVANAIDGYIRPQFVRFAGSTAMLRGAVDGFCAAPSGPAYDRAAKAYRDALSGFARINFLRFGPLLVEHRLERLVFWPDRKSIGRRQAETIVRVHDESVLTLAALQDKSVAVQGLSALEPALFDHGRKAMLAGGPNAAFRCSYAKTIMENVTGIADALVAEWAADDGYARLLLEPGADNAAFRDEKEAAGEILGAFTTGLQIVRDQQVEPILGSGFKRSKAKLALFRRSGNSLAMISAGIDGLARYLEALDTAAMLDEEYAWLPGSLRFQFKSVQATLAQIDEPLTKTLRNRDVYDKLDYVDLVIRSIRDAANQQLSVALGIQVGFNALDGD